MYNQSDQQVATALAKLKGFKSLPNPGGQLPNIWEILWGWGMLKEICM